MGAMSSNSSLQAGGGGGGGAVTAASGSYVTGFSPDISEIALDTDNLAGIKTDTDTLVPGIQGWIAATGTGTATTDDSITFATQVRKVVLYNAASVPVPIEFDTAAAATSIPILPGAFWVIDNILCTVVHVFPSATLPINTTAGLYVKGWK